MPGSAPTCAAICLALMRVGTRLAAEFDRRFARWNGSGLTQAQFRLLLRVREAGSSGIAPSRLAAALLIERAAVTRLAGRLIDSGHLARAPGGNRRTFNLILTAAGSENLGRAAPQASELAEMLLRELPSEAMQGAAALLTALEYRLRSEIAPRESAVSRGESEPTKDRQGENR